MKIIRNTANGILAGILISIGGSVFLACYGGGELLDRTIGSVFFSVALLCICFKGYSLFTGKVGYIPEKHDKEAFSVLLWGLLGNAIATVSLGLALRYAVPAIALPAETVCAAKLTQEWWQTLIRGIFCGILMYLAVSIYRDKKSVSAIFLCVPTFILAGFEHSIANMFYFGAAGMISLETVIYIAVVVLGNSVGGMALPLLSMLVEGGSKNAD